MFGHVFRFTAWLTLIVWAVALINVLRTQGWRRVMTSIPFQLYVLCIFAAVLLPYSVTFSWYRAWFGGIPERIGWLAAVLLCAVLAQATATTRLAVAFTVLNVLYFSFLYSSARTMNQMEQKVEALVTQLPAKAAVIADLHYPPGNGFDISMIVDRACIQRCFSFGNYEPSTMQFRVRAVPGNPVVAWSQTETVTQQFFSAYPDRTLYQIHACGTKPMDICMRALHRSDTDQPLAGDRQLLHRWFRFRPIRLRQTKVAHFPSVRTRQVAGCRRCISAA
jgi:Ca2+/Na+ antiporter